MTVSKEQDGLSYKLRPLENHTQTVFAHNVKIVVLEIIIILSSSWHSFYIHNLITDDACLGTDGGDWADLEETGPIKSHTDADEVFHQTSAPLPNSKQQALCGNLSFK